jgi:hypothetical protein
MRRRALVAALSTLVGLVVCAPQAAALPDGLALAPPMGFDNWNTTHCRAEFNEAMVKGIADKFVDSGLKSAGYRYVNIDDCWAKQRYRKMRDALQATGRPIVFSICEGSEPAVGVGERHRPPVAHHRRHQRHVGEDPKVACA